MIDWDKTSKESCIEIIEGLREQIKKDAWAHQERAVSMQETSDMVRSLYVPKIREMIGLWKEHEQTKFTSDGSHFQVDIKINQLMDEFKRLVGAE